MSDNEQGLEEKLANAQGGQKKTAFRQSKSPSPRWQQLEDNTPQKQASFQHYKFCAILMIMAFLGALSMQMGLSIGPDDCDNDNFFEIIGGVALWFSVLAIPYNGLIFLSSLFAVKSGSYVSIARLRSSFSHFFDQESFEATAIPAPPSL